MKICHITSRHPPEDGRIFQRACCGLAREGHNVTLIAVAPCNTRVDGVNILAIPKMEGLRRRLLSSFQAYRLALKTDADIYHFHDPDLLPWMVVLRLHGRKVVYDIHENYVVRFYQWNIPKPLDGLLAGLFRRFEKFAIRHLDGIVVVTETVADLFKDSARDTLIVNNVPDLIRLRGTVLKKRKGKRPIIYSSGNHMPKRNCFQMIEALQIIAKKIPNVRMVFAGRYYPKGYEARLREKAVELNVGENVEIEGMLPWVENFNRTAQADIGCDLLEDNLNHRVTLSTRLFEYMFCGLPVIVQDFPEFRRVVDSAGCGILIDSSSPKEIAAASLYLLENPRKAAEMGRRGRKAVLERYNFNIELDKMLEFYKNLLERH